MPRKGRVDKFRRSWRNYHSATKISGNSQIKAPSVKICILE